MLMALCRDVDDGRDIPVDQNTDTELRIMVTVIPAVLSTVALSPVLTPVRIPHAGDIASHRYE